MRDETRADGLLLQPGVREHGRGVQLNREREEQAGLGEFMKDVREDEAAGRLNKMPRTDGEHPGGE